jgi:hypothetical protein
MRKDSPVRVLIAGLVSTTVMYTVIAVLPVTKIALFSMLALNIGFILATLESVMAERALPEEVRAQRIKGLKSLLITYGKNYLLWLILLSTSIAAITIVLPTNVIDSIYATVMLPIISVMAGNNIDRVINTFKGE